MIQHPGEESALGFFPNPGQSREEMSNNPNLAVFWNIPGQLDCKLPGEVVKTRRLDSDRRVRELLRAHCAQHGPPTRPWSRAFMGSGVRRSGLRRRPCRHPHNKAKRAGGPGGRGAAVTGDSGTASSHTGPVPQTKCTPEAEAGRLQVGDQPGQFSNSSRPCLGIKQDWGCCSG